MPAEFDDLSRRLSDLQSDVAHVHMAGPAAARRRGRQRTRSRAVAVALGSAAAVAIGIGALDALPQTTSTPEPIDTPTPQPEPTPNPTRTPDPSPTPDESEPDPLAELLLAPSDLAELESHWWGEVEWGAVEWTEQTSPGLLECLPAALSAPSGGATPPAMITFAGSEASTRAEERIRRYESADVAEDAVSEFRAALGQCAADAANVELTRTWEYDELGDGAFQSELVLPADVPDAAHRALVGAAWTGSTIVLTMTDVHTRDVFNGEADMLAAAVARVCDGACVGELTPRQTYPAPNSVPDDLLLLDEDVNPIGGYDEFARADVRTNPDRYEYFCVPDLVIWGIPAVGGEAPNYYQAEWYGPSEGSFHETVIQFPLADTAAAYLADHEALPEQCGEVVETHEQVVNQPTPVQVSGADEALVWTIDERVLPSDPGSEPSFHGVGMARSGNVVVVIGFAAFGDPTAETGGTWADYATQTLALAIARAQG